MNIVDFESYSPVPITAGSVKYASHPDADIIVKAYKIGDAPAQAWLPGMALTRMPGPVHAHNALFDYLIWMRIGFRRYNFPAMHLADWRDSMALANRFTLPSALAKAGEVLKVKQQKSAAGNALIKKICVPTKDGRRPALGRDFTNAQLEDFVNYALQDVESTHDLIKALPSDVLSEDEQALWLLTQEMNLTGLPVDIEAAIRILDYIQSYAEEMSRRVTEITDGRVEKVTQVKRMVDFIQSRGVAVSNLQAATVDKLLVSDLPEDIRELLELRQTLGRSSTAKFAKIIEMEYMGRVFNNLHYHGAAPGRWAGRGFQMHNLPRASVPDPEKYIDDFMTFRPVEDPVNIAKALIRPMVCSRPGRILIVSDYNSIEYILLVWTAGDHKAVADFRNHVNQYKAMTAYMYDMDIADVEKGTVPYQIGKITILGCGYGMGGPRFKDTAAGFGVDISDGQSYDAVQAFRTKHVLVKKMWYALKNCVVDAIRNPGYEFKYRMVSCKVVKDRNRIPWLAITIPSGRNMYYCRPYVEEGKYGLGPGHYGINPYSKKWSRLALIPGRITENVIQGLARDVMGNGLLAIKRDLPQIDLLGTVHDEAIGEMDEHRVTDTTMDEFNDALCELPLWAEGLPLRAEGYIAKRYRK